MPGTTRPEFYEMSFEDVVAIALADEATLLMQVDAEAAAELKRAAQWVVNQKPGIYDMQDVLGLK